MNRREYDKQWRENHRHPCPDCGKTISWHAKYCRNCSKKRQWHEGKYSYVPPTAKGSEHWNWKGGKAKHSDGYTLLLRPEHPRANTRGYVLEHIVVWEEAHGQSLPKGWRVHHYNGIGTDNRPRNLIGLPNMKHKLLLAAMAKHIQELEALLKAQGQLL